MSARHRADTPGEISHPVTPESFPAIEPWWTADDGRVLRAEEIERATGHNTPNMPPSAYVAMSTARDRLEYRQARARRTLFYALCIAAIIAGLIGLALTRPIPGIG